MTARVLGLGQPFAGDDGVGVAVVERLRATGEAGSAALLAPVDPAELPALLEGVERVVLVDAVLDEGAPGRVLALGPEALALRRVVPLSSHGLDVGAAIELARALGAAPVVRIVGVTIAAARPFSPGLSPEVARAIPEAARAVVVELG